MNSMSDFMALSTQVFMNSMSDFMALSTQVFHSPALIILRHDCLRVRFTVMLMSATQATFQVLWALYSIPRNSFHAMLCSFITSCRQNFSSNCFRYSERIHKNKSHNINLNVIFFYFTSPLCAYIHC
jgi:hypothetical protein